MAQVYCVRPRDMIAARRSATFSGLNIERCQATLSRDLDIPPGLIAGDLGVRLADLAHARLDRCR